MEPEDFFKFLLGAAYLIYWLVAQYLKHRNSARKRAPRQQPTVVRPTQPKSPPRSEVPVDESPVDLYVTAHRHHTEQLTQLLDKVRRLSEGARLQRATHPMSLVLDEYLEPRVRSLLGRLERRDASIEDTVIQQLDQLELVFSRIEVFVVQRQDTVRRAQLGDADALAMSCYRPLIEFAQAEGLPLTSNRPVTELGGYDLSTWVGFIPTGLAPIFLPAHFFEQIFWWPALAHEIAHDFFAAVQGFSPALRRQFGLPSELVGTQLLPLGGGPLTKDQLWQLCGGWFEELFCDVFATLMLGPAYGHSMVHLFAEPAEPYVIAMVARSSSSAGRYDVHPPRELRVRACVHLLERMGHEQTALEVLSAWRAAHGGEQADAVFFPQRDRSYVAISTELLEAVVAELVDRLIDEPLEALAGYRLRDIPGGDYGPNLEAQGRRACAAFLEGRVPDIVQARAIIAGAVLAAVARPDAARAILKLACRAIAAEGTFEHRLDAYEGTMGMFTAPLSAGESPLSHAERLRQSFLLHTVLAPPPSVRQRMSRRGLLSRPIR